MIRSEGIKMGMRDGCCMVTSKDEIDQLKQLWTVTHDGDLLSKFSRDILVKKCLVQRGNGFNWLTNDGVVVVEMIRELERRESEKK